jgi:hypothetical protein
MFSGPTDRAGRGRLAPEGSAMDRRTALRTLAAATVVPWASPNDLRVLREARGTVDHQESGPFRPAALSSHELELVKAVADIILPRTTTPGATDVGVHEFIDLIVAEWFESQEAARFKAGLADLDAYATDRFGRAFLEGSRDQQITIVTELDEDLARLQQAGDPATDPEDTFFHWMKRLTLTGYFTSEEGLRLTGYRTIPGRFLGCLVPTARP